MPYATADARRTQKKTEEAEKAKAASQAATIRLFDLEESNKELKRENGRLVAEFTVMQESMRQVEIVANSTSTCTC